MANVVHDLVLDQAAVDGFTAATRGPVVLPGQDGYDESRSIWNAMIDRHPAVVLRCSGPADVREGIAFARRHDLRISVKGGGHNVAGLAVADGALLLDMSGMRGVHVDPRERIVTAQAGCVLGDVDRETQAHGLAAVLGFVSETGIAGLTLGGGFGYLTRRFGWTVDNLRSVDLVTADGSFVTASQEENEDLFWALCGGGGNFGVATSFTYDLYDVGPEIVAGAIAYRGEDTRDVLAFLKDFAAQAPPELTLVAGLRPAPPAPWLPEEVHGELIAAVFVCHTGSVEQGERDLAPLKAFGSPVGDVITRRPYVQQQTLLDATQPKGRRYYWKSEYLPGLDDGLLDVLSEKVAAGIPSKHSAVLLFQLDGTLSSIAADANAAGNRDAEWVLNVAGSWETADEDTENLSWARDVHAAAQPFSTGGVYVNFLTEEEGDSRIRAAYGDNWDRLRDVKRSYDPDNVFSLNKNIPS